MWLRKWPEPLCDLSPGLFTFGGLYYNPEHSIVLARSLFLHLLTSKSEELWIFLDVFILHLNFSKALGLCQTSCTVCARYLLIFPLFLHLCQVFELIFSSQSHKLHALVLCFFPQILFRLLASYTAIIGMNINSVSTFMFWLTMWLFLAFSSLVSLSSRGIDPNFLGFLFYFTCSSISLSDSDKDSEFTLSLSDCLPFFNLIPLVLALERLFSAILLVKSSNMNIRVSAKCWTLIFRHACKLSCCFMLFNYKGCFISRICHVQKN